MGLTACRRLAMVHSRRSPRRAADWTATTATTTRARRSTSNETQAHRLPFPYRATLETACEARQPPQPSPSHPHEHQAHPCPDTNSVSHLVRAGPDSIFTLDSLAPAQLDDRKRHTPHEGSQSPLYPPVATLSHNSVPPSHRLCRTGRIGSREMLGRYSRGPNGKTAVSLLTRTTLAHRSAGTRFAELS